MKPVQRSALFVCSACRWQAQRSITPRAFSATATRKAQASQQPSATEPPTKTLSGLSASPSSALKADRGQYVPAATLPISPPHHDQAPDTLSILDNKYEPESQWAQIETSSTARGPHRLHVYAHKHNTHLTLVQAPKLAMDTMSSDISRTTATAADRRKVVDVLLTRSTGNIGFRKAGRGTYDAAFQLGAFFLRQMKERGMFKDLRELEVVFRGFGPGREAIQKILLGTEGKQLRGRIVSVMDATRLKIGGCRSPKPRRL